MIRSSKSYVTPQTYDGKYKLILTENNPYDESNRNSVLIDITSVDFLTEKDNGDVDQRACRRYIPSKILDALAKLKNINRIFLMKSKTSFVMLVLFVDDEEDLAIMKKEVAAMENVFLEICEFSDVYDIGKTINSMGLPYRVTIDYSRPKRGVEFGSKSSFETIVVFDDLADILAANGFDSDVVQLRRFYGVTIDVDLSKRGSLLDVIGIIAMTNMIEYPSQCEVIIYLDKNSNDNYTYEEILESLNG